ncbi:MAG: Flp pilus assembly complex ATPase component TadA [Magnetococcales bacterium]|nr:Flp pilus assembly complex ATPase component TadA [Magnetococcales bacterium]MBF0157821.1 Flp pilus assembly complex ATPase component TadA [Magnetococcales bacterium]
MGSTPLSDRRLRELAGLAPLREYLDRHRRIEPELLKRMLNLTANEEQGSLIQCLVRTGLILPEELQEAKKQKRLRPGEPLWQLLAEADHLGPQALALAIAATSNLPFLRPRPEEADPRAVRSLRRQEATRLVVLPWRFLGNTLEVAAAEPRDGEIEAFFAAKRIPIALMVAEPEAILGAIEYWFGEERDKGASIHFGRLDLSVAGASPPTGSAPVAGAPSSGSGSPPDPRHGSSGTALPEVPGPEAGRVSDPDGDTVTAVATVPPAGGGGSSPDPDDQSAVSWINRIILEAVEQEASDIHIVPEEGDLCVVFRLDGKLHERRRLPKSLHLPFVSRIKVLAGMDIAERRLPQDGNMRVRLPGRFLDIRISSLPSVRGEALSMRLLDSQVNLVPMDELGFFAEDQRRLRQAISQPHGLILLTGPTGSGKSTTLRAAMEVILQAESRHILTVEDPVEVKMDRVVQVQVNQKIGFTFARALRHFLRHDPDVIMVGEIRDGETAQIAVQAALTGHLVLSTLHTNDAPGVITRLLDMGVDPYLAASALRLVIGQRLVRALCPHCRQSGPPEGQESALFRAVPQLSHPDNLFRAGGCPHCNRTGYKGRTVIYEVLVVDDRLRGMIQAGKNATLVKEAALAQGFQPLVANGLRKVAEGWTSMEELWPFVDLASLTDR